MILKTINLHSELIAQMNIQEQNTEKLDISWEIWWQFGECQWETMMLEQLII